MNQQPETQRPPRRIDRLLRLGGYAFWTTAGFMLPLVIDRLLVRPALNQSLGPEVFGGFVWVFGVLNMVTNAGSMGFAVLLMRRLAGMQRGEAATTAQTACTLALALSVLILSLAAVISYPFAPPEVRANAWVLYGPLLGYAILSGTIQVLINVLRIRRRFAFTFVLKVIEGGVLLLILVAAPTKMLWLVGLIYIASMLLPMAYGMSATTEFRGRDWLHRSTAKWLLAGWAGGALISLSESAQRNLSHVLVGSLTDSSKQVAILYAGTSIGNIFVMPVSRLSMLILALLAGHQAFALKGRKGLQYAVGVALLMLTVGGASYFLGGWLVTNRYPDLADQTLAFYHWIALANAFAAVVLRMRPVAVKYAPLKLAAGASVAGALIQITALSIFIPRYQAQGAAIGMATASGCSSLMWVITYIVVSRKHAEQDAATDASDQTADE